MSGYERPTERGTSPTRVSFWATIAHHREGHPVEDALVSPAYGTQLDLIAWVRANRREGDTVAAWKRTIRGADYHDERLSARDEPAADPARLRALLEELSALLDAKKRELDRRRAA